MVVTGRRPFRKRTNSVCDRGFDPDELLRCSGARIDGSAITQPHWAARSEYSHNNYACEQGRSRCVQAVCKDCMAYRRRYVVAANKDRFAGMSDAQIKAAASPKRCPGCRRTKPPSEYWVDRSNDRGLTTRCIDCLRVDKREYMRKWRAGR